MMIVDKEGKRKKRLKAVSPRDKILKEEFLQRLIYEEPELLPTQDIDPAYSHLIPVKKEFSIRSGSIDVLYITPEGRICIVETKLWRNPEAHRTVIAQILDYANDLSNLSFQDFCEIITKQRGDEAIQAFFKDLKRKLRDFDEIEIQQNIQDSLTHGRFLLLIVGDKIYPEVALITESIQSAPHLEFNLALAELSFYHSGSEFLVIPSVVGKTFEVTRAIVKIRYEEKKPEVEVTALEEKDRTIRGKTNLKEFLSQMPEGFPDIFDPVFQGWFDNGFTISWGTVGFTLRLQHKGKMKTILEFYPYNMSIFTDLWAKKKSLPLDICKEFQNNVKHIREVNRLMRENRVYLYYQRIEIGEFSVIMSEIDKTARKIIDFYGKV